MSFTYQFLEPENAHIRRVDENGRSIVFPTNVDNRHYREFLDSSATALAFVEPPAPPEPTPEEKLASSGLTVDELKELLGLNS